MGNAVTKDTSPSWVLRFGEVDFVAASDVPAGFSEVALNVGAQPALQPDRYNEVVAGVFVALSAPDQTTADTEFAALPGGSGVVAQNIPRFADIDGGLEDTGTPGTFVEISAGAGDAGKPVVLDSTGVLDSSLLDAGSLPAHGPTHEDGGSDEISVAGLSGLLADDQNPTAHASDHSLAASDQVTIENLHTATTTATQALFAAGANAAAFRAITSGDLPAIAHASLTDLTAPADDHPQYSLTDGSRIFTGDIDLGTNAITNVGDVDGRDVSADGATLDAHVGNTSTTAPHTNPMLALRTGVRNGGIVTIASGTTFDISDGDGLIVDNATNPSNPVPTPVSWSGLTGITATQIGTSEKSVIFIDATSSPVQLIAPGPRDRRDKIALGFLSHNGATLTNVEQIGGVIYEQDWGFDDLMSVFGLINAVGNVYSRGTVGALGLDVTLGDMFFPGINRTGTIFNDRNPNFKPQIFGTDISWTYIRGDGTATGITTDSTGVTAINVTQVDDGAGGLSNMTGSNWKVDLIFRHPDGATVVQFGSIQFSSRSEAVAAAITSATPLLGRDFVWRFALVVRRNATDLDVDGQFVERTGAGGSASAGAGGGDVLGPSGGVVAGELSQYADGSGKVIEGTGILAVDVLERDGSVIMTGDLDMGSQNIVSVGTVDGVTVSAHASRHEASGADEITGTSLELTRTAVNYTSAGNTLGQHLTGIDTALASAGDALTSRDLVGMVASFTTVATLTVSAGSARSEADDFTITVGSPTVVNIAVVGLNGLDTGAENANSWYYLWAIGDVDEVEPSGYVLSLSPTTPTLPTNYDRQRLIMLVRNHTGDLFRWVQLGDLNERSVYWDEQRNQSPQRVTSGGGATSFSTVDCSVVIPPGTVEGIFSAQQSSTSIGTRIRPSGSNDPGGDRFCRQFNSMQIDVPMTNQDMQYENTGSGGSFTLGVLGWRRTF